jgi:hypothetical protein
MPLGAFSPQPQRLGGSPEEGITAAQHARRCADLVAIQRTQPLFAFRFSQVAFPPPYAVTMVSYLGQQGVGLDFAPPTVTVVGEGHIQFQFDTPAFEDEYEVQQAWKVRHALVMPAIGSASNRLHGHWYPLARGIEVITLNEGGAVRAAVNGCTVIAW